MGGEGETVIIFRTLNSKIQSSLTRYTRARWKGAMSLWPTLRAGTREGEGVVHGLLLPRHLLLPSRSLPSARSERVELQSGVRRPVMVHCL